MGANYLVDVIRDYLINQASGVTTDFESAISGIDVILNKDIIEQVQQMLRGQNRATSLDINLVLVEAHLRKFPYSRDRLEEFKRIAEMYKTTSSQDIVDTISAMIGVN